MRKVTGAPPDNPQHIRSQFANNEVIEASDGRKPERLIAHQTPEIDSKPGFIFTATSGPLYAAVVKPAQDEHKKVNVTYTSFGPNSRRIVSVRLA